MITISKPLESVSSGKSFASHILFPEKPEYLYKYTKECYAKKAQAGLFHVKRSDQYSPDQSSQSSKSFNLTSAQQDNENERQIGFSNDINYALLESKENDLQHEILISEFPHPMLKGRAKNIPVIPVKFGAYCLYSFSLSKSIELCDEFGADTILVITDKHEIIGRFHAAAKKVGLCVASAPVQYIDPAMNPPMFGAVWNLTPFSKDSISKDKKINYKKQNEFRIVFWRTRTFWQPRTWLPLPKKLELNIGSIHDISEIISREELVHGRS